MSGATAETAPPVARCPLCGGEPGGLAFPYGTVWNGKEFRYHGCRGCGSTFVVPVPTGDELRAIYGWDNYHAVHYPEADPARYRRSLALLAARGPAGRTLLDFGCGNGGFLTAAKGAGYEAHGVEYEASTIARASEAAGGPVTDLETVLGSGLRFDVVRLADVHLHLPDPAGTFRTLETLLTPGGLFLVEGPLENNASLVLFATTATKGLRRRLGLDRPAAGAPTMLARVNRRAQRDFFRRRLGYGERSFEVFETGWPYLIPGRPARSAADRVKRRIGALAVALGRLQPGSVRLLGNRFIGLYDPFPEVRP